MSRPLDSTLTLYIVLGFFTVFPLIWILVIQIISLASGWKSLAFQFRTRQKAPENTRYSVSGMMGISRYNGVLNVGFNQMGLYLSVIFLFRPGQPPLLIPWEEIAKIEPGKWIFFGKVYRIYTKKGVTIMIPSKYLQGIGDYFPLAEE
ncbi:MAG: hypothetical protein AAFU64_02080 [Bacteroidota bacterium]